jgi:integrase
VVNYAIGEGQATTYAFKKFRIRREVSVKRSMSLEDMQRLWAWEGATEYEQWYLDIFKVSFGLCGMNVKDLYELMDTDVVDGRVERDRSKTDVHLSIRIEPEVWALIERHKGHDGHLLDIAERWHSHRDFLSRMNRGLRVIGKVEEERVGCVRRIVSREPQWPWLSSYWARHTWATIAANMEIPIETIALGLGHAVGNAMTNVYIRPDLRRLDEANRRVMDAVTGRKETALESAGTTAVGEVSTWGGGEFVYVFA